MRHLYEKWPSGISIPILHERFTLQGGNRWEPVGHDTPSKTAANGGNANTFGYIAKVSFMCINYSSS